VSLKIKIVLPLLAFPLLCNADEFTWVKPQHTATVSHFDESHFLPAPRTDNSENRKTLSSASRPKPKPVQKKPSRNNKDTKLIALQRDMTRQQQAASQEIEQLNTKIAALEAQLILQKRETLFSAYSFSPAIAAALHATTALFLPAPASKAVYLRADPGSSASAVAEDKLTDYATGVMIGKNITLMQQRNKLLNIPTDRDAIFTGIEDYLNNRTRVAENQLLERIEEREINLQDATEALAWRHRQAGAKFTEKFIKRTGVHRSPAGFYYKLDKRGKGRLAANNIVDIRVAEKLIDGTVVNDMNRTGAIISQHLNAYPPLFREAIEHTGKGGVITMLVPPELAYGDSGQPPVIPPGATILYTLSVLDVKA